MKLRYRTSEFNFWPSVADMILAVLMTFLLIWFAEQFLFLNQNQGNVPSNEPSIIRLYEADGYKFPTGKAELSEGFKERLQGDVKEKIKNNLDQYKANVIEVIGHTDGQVAGGQSNLDDKLGEVIAGGPIDTLRYGSNADLGLMRALAVAMFLKQQKEFVRIKFRVYSAAQILPNGELTEKLDRKANQQYRRIELRVTQLESK